VGAPANPTLLAAGSLVITNGDESAPLAPRYHVTGHGQFSTSNTPNNTIVCDSLGRDDSNIDVRLCFVDKAMPLPIAWNWKPRTISRMGNDSGKVKIAREAGCMMGWLTKANRTRRNPLKGLS
jgi:hypothetical protein